MMTNQLRGVDRAGRSLRFGRAIREERCAAIRIDSHSHVTSAVLALLVALVLVGRDQVALGQAQEPAAANPAEPAADNQDVSLRYRFLERYSANDDPTRPELLIQYQVGIRETVKITFEKPQGAPDLQRTTGLGIYAERVAKVSSKGAVTEVVRNFKKVDLKTTLDIPRYKTPLLQGLTVLYLPQGRFLPPQVLSLTPGRQLRPLEYDGIRQQAFLPNVSLILPSKPCRVGDTWPVRREAVFALLGNVPAEEDYDLTAEVLEIRKHREDPAMTAIIAVKGQLVIPEGPCGLNAQVHFTFVPAEVAAPPGSRPRDEINKDLAPDSKPAPAPAGRVKGVFDANGYISKISLAQEMTWPLPGNDGRLKGNMRREILLERRIPAQPGGDGDILEIPNPEPVPGVSNSWLVYDDPQGRFHLLFPQEFRVARTYPEGGIDLLDRRPDGRDVIQISLVAKTGDPGRDSLASDPIQVKKQLEDQWKQRGEKVVSIPSGWLPAADWSPSKWKVYRIEAALIPEGERSPESGRIYLDHYIVQFARNEVMVVEAITNRDMHKPFRDSAELIIKSFEFGPSESSLPSAPARVPRNAPTNVPATPPTNVPRTPRPS